MSASQFNIQAGTDFPAVNDQEGSQLNLLPGKSSGFGRAVVSIKKGGVGLISGMVENILINGLIIGGFKTLVDNITVNLLSIVVNADTSASVVLTYTIEAYDGTNLQLETGILTFQVLNKAGVFSTKVFDTDPKPTQLLSQGSLSVVFGISSANPAVVSVVANTSLTPSPGRLRINFSMFNLGNQEVTLL
jgi:hypothetical protein